MADMSGIHLLRITLQAASPLAIGSGNILIREAPDETSREAAARIRLAASNTDPQLAAAKRWITLRSLVRDADGFPTIPPRSLRGAVRHLAQRRHHRAAVDALLGWQGFDHDGGAGRVHFGWARIHGQTDACPPRDTRAEGENDEILARLREEAPLERNHIAIDHRGIVDGRRKYLMAAVPMGTRFSLQLTMRGVEREWDAKGFTLSTLLDLLANPELRLGRGSTRGYGALTIVRASRCWLPLSPEGVHTLRKKRAELPSEHFKDNITPSRYDDVEVHEIELKTRDLVGISTGASTDSASYVPPGESWTPVVGDYAPESVVVDGHAKPAPLLVETVIEWPQDGKGQAAKLANAFSFPAASLKGPLAHRTLYWWNRQNKRVIDMSPQSTADDRAADLSKFKHRPPALQALLGAIKDSRTAQGRMGTAAFQDGVFKASHVMRVDHTSIDRFTGGVRDRLGALFAEELLFGATAKMHFTLRRPPDIDSEEWTKALAALRASLDDLVGGRLPIGGRGWGRMSGSHSLGKMGR